MKRDEMCRATHSICQPGGRAAAAQAALAKYESDGQRRMLELQRSGRDGLWITDTLWAGVGLVRGGAGTAMVGDGAAVAELMNEYARRALKPLYCLAIRT